MTILWFDNTDTESKSIVHKVDDNFKVITNLKCIQSDGGTVVHVSKLTNSTSEPKIRITHVNYQIFRNRNVKLTQGKQELNISGRGNYGWKPTETKLVDEAEQSVQLLADATVPRFNISLECHKESGFEV